MPELAFDDLLRDALKFVTLKGIATESERLHQYLHSALRKELEKMEKENDNTSSDDVSDEIAQRRSAWHDLRCGFKFQFLLTESQSTLFLPVKARYLKYLSTIIRDKHAEEDRIVLLVSRDGITEGVCRRLGILRYSETSSAPRGLLQIEFKNEDGEDQGGLTRSWLELTARHFVRSDLFLSIEDDAAHLESCSTFASCRQLGDRKWVPAPIAVCRAVQADWAAQFVLLGSIMGYALLHTEVLPVKFARHFMQLVLGVSLSIDIQAAGLFDQLKKVDETLAQKKECIASGQYTQIFGVDSLVEALDSAGLPCTFIARDSKAPDLTGCTELVTGGVNIIVNEDNKQEFLQRTACFHISQSISQQAALVRKGLLRTICPKLLDLGDTDEILLALCTAEESEVFAQAELLHLIQRCLSGDELEQLMAGHECIDLDAWRKCAVYEDGYQRGSQNILRFWEVLESFNAQERSQLLTFVRGSSALPADGFNELEFIIRRVSGGPGRLPEAHTCEFSLDLPEYDSTEQLAAKLRVAIAEQTFAVR